MLLSFLRQSWAHFLPGAGDWMRSLSLNPTPTAITATIDGILSGPPRRPPPFRCVCLLQCSVSTGSMPKKESWGSLARSKHLKNRNPKSLRVCHWKQLAGPCSPVYISYRVKAVNAEDRINFMTSACINRYCFPRKDVLQAGKHL